MKDLIILLAHLLTTVAKLMGKGGARSIVADILLMKQQLLIVRRHQHRSPPLTPCDRLLLGFWSLFLSPRQIYRAAVIIQPSTLLKFHALLVKRKYGLLYTSKRKCKPGPNGPSQEIIEAVLALKRRNPRFGLTRIAQQINNTFGTCINRDIVRRILATHYQPGSVGGGPSWLSFLGHTKDSLWSTDLFRCESILLKSHWVLVVMDQCTRRIIGFGVHVGDVDGAAVCSMFNRAISNKGIPCYLSTDNDPLFQYQRWKANLRILEIEEIKSIPYTPTSHPFIERLIGTIRHEYLDQLFFWNSNDLEKKLASFAEYYNYHRVHQSLDGKTPENIDGFAISPVNLKNYSWQSHCNQLYDIPFAA